MPRSIIASIYRRVSLPVSIVSLVITIGGWAWALNASEATRPYVVGAAVAATAVFVASAVIVYIANPGAPVTLLSITPERLSAMSTLNSFDQTAKRATSPELPPSATLDLSKLFEGRMPEVPDGWELVKLHPNIEPIAQAYVKAHNGEEGAIVEGTLGIGENFDVHIQRYANKRSKRRKLNQPVQNIASASQVSAQLIYKSIATKNTTVIHTGCWLNEKAVDVTFPKDGRPQSLVIASVEGEDLFCLSREVSGVYPEGRTIRRPLLGELISVSITLVNPDGILESSELMIEADRSTMQLTISRLRLWMLLKLLQLTNEGMRLSIKYYESKEDGQELANEVREWALRCAEFIGAHLTESQKEAFLNARPSIDEGANLAKRTALFPRESNQRGKLFGSTWDLHDSIQSRVDKLREFSKPFE